MSKRKLIGQHFMAEAISGAFSGAFFGGSDYTIQLQNHRPNRHLIIRVYEMPITGLKPKGRPIKLVEEGACNNMVFWWDGEYEGECKRPDGHRGNHYDGISWWDDNGNEVDEH